MNMTWNLLGAPIQGGAAGEKFGLGLGQSLEITPDGRTLVVGISSYDGVNGTATNTGQARVFKYDDDIMDWVQMGMGIDGLNPEDNAGDVAINSQGNVVAIGAGGYDDGNFTTKSGIGQVRVFVFDNAGAWNQIGTEILGDMMGDNAGPVALDASGRKLFVGIGGFDDPVGSAGAVRAYELVDGNSTCDLSVTNPAPDGTKSGSVKPTNSPNESPTRVPSVVTTLPTSGGIARPSSWLKWVASMIFFVGLV